jgi:hypothetical protein
MFEAMPKRWLSSTSGISTWSSENYRKFALQQIEEAKRFVTELGLKQN